MTLLALGSCADVSAPSETYVFLLHELFVIYDDTGPDIGVNIDGAESSFLGTPPEGGCAHDDYEGGVDNALARVGLGGILRALGDPNELLQQSVDLGRLVLLVEISDADSLENDDHVNLRLIEGQGVGLVNRRPDGRAESGQTFRPRPEVEPLLGEGRIVDGVLEGSFTGETLLPVALSQAEATLRLTQLTGSVALDGAQGGRGVFGAVAGFEGFVELARGINEEDDDGIATAIAPILQARADASRTESGACEGITMGIRVGVTQAFIYDEPPE